MLTGTAKDPSPGIVIVALLVSLPKSMYWYSILSDQGPARAHSAPPPSGGEVSDQTSAAKPRTYGQARSALFRRPGKPGKAQSKPPAGKIQAVFKQ
jgi:hypothetical protein